MMNDEHWMQLALGLAERVAYITSPNPRVGCVIVRGGAVIASGATQEAGGPHAEIMALMQARQRDIDVQGATIYVSLEPCSHYGRTPPCVDALIAARPGRVVVAMLDPNPLVAGRGVQRLREAGIQVTVGLCANHALAMNPGFVSRMTRRRPWVWLKLAASLDGRIALPDGQSKWITSPQARADGHAWRARSCAVLTGTGTVACDDPQLNVRDVLTPRQPVRVVVDSNFAISEKARLFDGGKVIVFTCTANDEKAMRLADRNVQVVSLPSRDGKVDLMAMMHWLGANDINEVHVEAGARLSGALLGAGCVDELVVYLAPLLLGEGIGMVNFPTLSSLTDALRFELIDHQAIGPDLRLRVRSSQSWQSLQNSLIV